MPGAGLLPAALLVQRIGLASLIDRRLHLPVEAANSGVKACTVLGSMLAGGDSIDDVALLRAAAMPVLFDQTREPSTIGSWLRAFRWANVREMDVNRPGMSGDFISWKRMRSWHILAGTRVSFVSVRFGR